MNGKDAFRLVLPVLPLESSLSPLETMNSVSSNITDIGGMESNSSTEGSSPSNNQPSASSRGEYTAPISVPLRVYQAAHFNLPTEPMGKISSLDILPSPVYSFKGQTGRGGLSGVDDDAMARSRPRFALGGLLGAASPRSLSVDSRDSGILDSPSSSLGSGNSGIGSTPSLTRMGSTSSADSDVFALYGSHIPASISHPIPKRSHTAPSVTVRADEEFYISTR